MNLTTVDFNQPVVDDAKHVVFKVTFEDNNMFVVDGTAYLIPDQYNQITDTNAYFSSVSDVTNSKSRVISTLSEDYHVSLGVQTPYFGVKASYTNAFGYVHDTYKESSIAGSDSYYKAVLYKVLLQPPQVLDLNRYFIKYTSIIPQCPKTDDDMRTVTDFLAEYGTSYMKTANLGAKCYVFTTFSQSFVNSSNTDWVYSNLELTANYKMFEIGGGHGMNKSDIHIAEAFKAHTKTVVKYIGGSTGSMDPDGPSKEWRESIIHFPMPIGGELGLLSNLIEDKLKSKALEEIIKNYINTGGQVKLPSCAVRNRVSTGEELLPISGISILGTGFSTLSRTPLASIFNSHNSFENGYFFDYPFGSKRVSVPDRVKVINSPHNAYENSFKSFSLFEEYSTYLKTHEEWNDGGVFGIGANHHTRDYIEYHYRLAILQQKSTLYKRKVSMYKLEMSPMCIMKPTSCMSTPMKKYIEKLPVGDPNDPVIAASYEEFFESVGTAVVKGVLMGGEYEIKSFTKGEFSKSIDFKQLKETSSFSILGIINGGSNFMMGNPDNKPDFVKEFLKHTQFEISTHGGNWEPDLSVPKEVSFTERSHQGMVSEEKFIETIKDNPVPVDYELMPIIDIIEDEKIATTMKHALTNYLKKQVDKPLAAKPSILKAMSRKLSGK